MTVLVFYVLVLCGLAVIPAKIAEGKGRDFMTWWVYGFLLWIIAVVHALALKGPEQLQRDAAILRGGSEAEELARFAQLKADGHLSDAEFEAKKRQLLRL